MLSSCTPPTILAGGVYPKPLRLLRIAALLALIAACLQSACRGEQPVVRDPSVVCRFSERAPVIDGRLDEACWRRGAALEGFLLPGDRGPARKPTQVFLAYDRKGVYVGFRCVEPSAQKLKLTEKQKIWRNDSVEVLIASDRKREGYLHFMVDAGGGRLLLKDGVPGEGSLPWPAGHWRSAVAVSAQAWTAELFLPFNTLGVTGDITCLRANFARNEQGLLERSSWTPRVGSYGNALRFGNVYIGNLPRIVADLTLPPGFTRGPVNADVTLTNKGRSAVTIDPVVQIGERAVRLARTVLKPAESVKRRVGLEIPRVPVCGLDVFCSTPENRARIVLGSYRLIPAPVHEAAMGSTLSVLPWGTVWEASATSKVMPNAAVPRARARAVEVFCARNEFEPFQIVLTPKRELRNVRATASDLVGPGTIARASISVRRVETVPVATASSSDCLPGEYPDPLVPFTSANVPAGRNTALWFTIRVSPDARPGDYKGNVTLSADGIEPVSVPVHLRVWSFVLPEVSRLRTAYGCDYEALCRWHGAGNDEDRRRIAELTNRNFVEHRVAPINPLRYWDLDTEIVDGKLTVDFSGYDAGAAQLLPKLSAFNVPGAFMGRVGNDPPGTEAYERLKLPFLQQLAAYLRSRGWIDKAYCYIYDEPREEDYAKVVREAGLWRKADPGLKILLTEPPEEPLFGSVDIWSPVLDAYIRENCRARQAKGEEVWWYVCCGPLHPFPNNFIDYPAIDHRILHWMNYKYGVTGVLYWQTMFWRHDPWTHPMSVSEDGKRNFGNGDGSLLYPAVKQKSDKAIFEGPLDSIRWEMIREGIEDYDYLMMLDDAVHAAEARGDAKLVNEGMAALAAAKALTRTTADYETDPRKLYAVRKRVAEALQRLQR